MEKVKKKRKFRFPLWAKTLTVLILSVFIVGGAAITFFSWSIKNVTRGHYIDRATQLADTLGIYLNLDEVETLKNKVDAIYQSIPEEERVENTSWGEPEWEEYLAKFSEITETPEYISLFEQISTFHAKNDAKFVCLTYTDLVNNRLIYLVDDADEEERCLPGSFDAFTESDIKASSHLEDGFPAEITNTEEYGHLVSIGRPIFDKSNNIIAISLIDLSMDEIIAKENESLRTLIIINSTLSAAIILIGSLLVLFLIARPVRILTSAANEYTKGEDEELNKFAQIKIRTKDEIEDLANSMKKMEKDINNYIISLLGAEKKADEMKHLADKDALTGVNSKRLYFEAEERLNEQIRKGEAKFAISMIDLNDLKKTNDTFGHEKGDEAILNLANAIKETFKNSEIYRIGGDEFAVISEGTDLENVRSLEKEFKIKASNKDNKFSAAIGVAIFDKKIDNNFEDTFKRADKKMYHHKRKMKD